LPREDVPTPTMPAVAQDSPLRAAARAIVTPEQGSVLVDPLGSAACVGSLPDAQGFAREAIAGQVELTYEQGCLDSVCVIVVCVGTNAEF